MSLSTLYSNTFPDDFSETRFPKLVLTAAGRFTTSSLELASLAHGFFFVVVVVIAAAAAATAAATATTTTAGSVSCTTTTSASYSATLLFLLLLTFPTFSLFPSRSRPCQTQVRHYHHYHCHYHQPKTFLPRPICSSLSLYGLRILSAELEYPWPR